MHRWQVERLAARGASTCLEHGRAAAKGGELLAFGFGFGAVGFGEAAVLKMIFRLIKTDEIGKKKTGRTDELDNSRWRFLFVPAQWCR